MQYRADLDGLRAIAVILVLLFHATFPIPGAFLGVDIFFTLSGYLITTLITASLRQNIFSLSSFYVRRSLRLLPAAATVITATALAALALLPLEAARQTVLSALAANASVSNIRYLLQSGYFDSDAIAKPLLHTWSLAVEEQFYLIWPFLLILFHRCLHPRAPFVFATAVVVISPYLSHLLIQSHPSAAFYLAPARFYELLLGAALSYIHPPSNSLLSQGFGIAGSIGLCLSVSLISSTDEFPSWRALAPCISTALLIHAGPQSFVSKALSVHPLTFIGKISYSVYLVHWPVVVFYRLLTGQDEDFRLGERLFMLGAAFLLGIPLNILVEKRFRASNQATKTERIEGLQDLDKESSDVGSWRSSRDFRKLLVLIVCVQIFLLFAFGTLNRPVEGLGRRTSTTRETHASGGNVASFDDYNAFNIDSVLRLNAEAEAAGYGRLEEGSVVPGYGDSGYYENGSVPHKRPPGEPKPGVPRILCIGDSHAAHLRYFNYHISKEFNAQVQTWQAPGCVFLLNVFNSFLKSKERTEPCRESIRVWKEKILAERFDTVIVSGRWAWLVEEDMYGSRKPQDKWHLLVEESAPAKTRTLSYDTGEWHTQYEESRRMFRKSIEESVKFLTATGARVVLVGQVPLLTSNPSGCTSYPDSQKAIAVGKQPDRCAGVTRDMALSRMRYVREVFEDIRLKHIGNVSILHPADVFCDNYMQDMERCRVVIKDLLLYRDRSHLNGLGASYLALRLRAKGYEGVRWDFLAPSRKIR